jgi:uncharacterized small protein (DUF1192 family)
MLRTGSSARSAERLNEGSNEQSFAKNASENTSENDASTTASPNRRKYERRFLDAKNNTNNKAPKRTPLAEKTNKPLEAGKVAPSKLSSVTEPTERAEHEPSKPTDPSTQHKDYHGTGSTNGVSIEELFYVPSSAGPGSLPSSAGSSSQSSSSFGHLSSASSHTHHHSKVEELTLALADSLRENEELHGRVRLLRAEVSRLEAELVENREYAELYLLSKELIDSQAAEIDDLKQQLKRVKG